ncbi:hypothetical protein [Planococcus koreensis]|uniref:hypothetical protein n=1 Tax=Planococcus koreensis TaxID=112331 RepID=UPI0010823054|nr:hypothetical protein [Planococcus koreensis]
MSNLFYEYITSILIKHFENIELNAGDRFFLRLDQAIDVENLVQVMKEHDGVEEFFYQHHLGEVYQTFALPFGQIKLVIANTSKDVKPDFLVTLRNLVGEQKKNLNILFFSVLFLSN